MNLAEFRLWKQGYMEALKGKISLDEALYVIAKMEEVSDKFGTPIRSTLVPTQPHLSPTFSLNDILSDSGSMDVDPGIVSTSGYVTFPGNVSVGTKGDLHIGNPCSEVSETTLQEHADAEFAHYKLP